MIIDEEQGSEISLVLESESDVFSELVELSGLRPEVDFQHSRLSDVDFSLSNLSSFNFDYADLRRVKWEGRQSDPRSLRYSLRGHGTDEVRGTDFAALSATTLSKSLWAERFFAFRLLVDNWGENPDTAEILAQLLDSSSGTYLPLCSFIYFSASYMNDSEAKALCVSMANYGRSQVNLFRLRKLRRTAIQNANYLESIKVRPRYPNDITQKDLKTLSLKAARTVNAGNLS